MTNEQNQPVTLSLAQENTRIRSCGKCGLVVQEKFHPEERRFMPALRREMIVAYEHWDNKLSDQGLCKTCEEARLAEHEKAKLTTLQRERAIDLKINLIEMLGGEKAYGNYTFDKYLAMENIGAFTVAQQFDPARDNVFFYGECGTGKTHLAAAIARTWYEKWFMDGRHRVEYWKTVQLLRRFRFKRTAEEEEDFVASLVEADVLVLDDLGSQKETDFGTMVILEILDRRTDQGRNGLVVTSNYGRAELADIFKDRIPSRLSGLCNHILKMTGTDHRGRSK